MSTPPRLTKREADCVGAVAELTSLGWPARLKDVAASMHVRAPTALEFVERLARGGFVEKGATGYRLTARGREVAGELVRAHRLFELLLFRSGMSLEEAHRISSLVDKHVDERATSELCAQLNHPKTCPHGASIPAGDRFDGP